MKNTKLKITLTDHLEWKSKDYREGFITCLMVVFLMTTVYCILFPLIFIIGMDAFLISLSSLGAMALFLGKVSILANKMAWKFKSTRKMIEGE